MIKMEQRRPRIALYSHDTMGLGHVRRNLLLGRTLASSQLEPNVLLLSGAIDTKSLYMPPGVDCATLPSLFKAQDGKYRSRRLRMPLDELVTMRRRILKASVTAFDPDLFIVDTAPWGVAGELDVTLAALTEGGRARRVLGMRDVWDDPSAISREWNEKNNWEALRKHYDQVWVYGDPLVYDTVREYGIQADIAGKVRYTGYLGRTPKSLVSTTNYAENLPDLRVEPFVLCVMGGGQDGVHLAEAFLDSELPPGRTGLIVTGPFMDPMEVDRLRQKAQRKGETQVIDFVPEPLFFMLTAESVVSMGGYNAVCEILSLKKRALIVPRSHPRMEQLIRARRLSELGLVEVLPTEELNSAAISEFLRKRPLEGTKAASVDLGGLSKVSELAASLIASKSSEGMGKPTGDERGQRA